MHLLSDCTHTCFITAACTDKETNFLICKIWHSVCCKDCTCCLSCRLIKLCCTSCERTTHDDLSHRILFIKSACHLDQFSYRDTNRNIHEYMSFIAALDITANCYVLGNTWFLLFDCFCDLSNCLKVDYN